MFKNSIKAVSHSVRYIFSHFGGLWILILKTFLALILMLMIVWAGIAGITNSNDNVNGVSHLFSGKSATDIAQMLTFTKPDPATSPADDEINTLLESPNSHDESDEEITETNEESSSTTLPAVGLILLGLTGVIATLFISSVSTLNIIHSVLQNKPLDTSVFKRLKDQDVCKYVKSLLAVYIPWLLGTLLIAILINIHIYFSAFGIILALYYFRTLWIPMVYATGDAKTLRAAWKLTKGNGFPVFMTYVWSTMPLLAYYVLCVIPQQLNSSLAEIAIPASAAIYIIFLPINFVGDMALAYLYKYKKST